MRTVVLGCLGIGIVTTLAAHAQAPGHAVAAQAAPARQLFAVVEANIPDMRRAMEEGRTTSREIVQQHLLRIALYEDRLNAVIAVNPGALRDAEERDRERARGKVRGPLHGIPIALKDNIHTLDVPTTGGVLAFDGLRPPYEATLTRLLREAGAVIIAKTGMTELAHWVSDGMPGNYNALSGHAMNPYDPRRDPREATFDGRPALSTGGSSSGTGTAASFWAANVGTETAGSILFPADRTMLAAIKPTAGRVSRHGIIPLTADQDTAGPMARSVTDAAILLGALEGPAPDPNDAATTTCTPPPNRDYTAFLKRDALEGARIGIPRAYFYDKADVPGSKEPRGGLNPERARVMAEAIAILQQQAQAGPAAKHLGPSLELTRPVFSDPGLRRVLSTLLSRLQRWMDSASGDERYACDEALAAVCGRLLERHSTNRPQDAFNGDLRPVRERLADEWQAAPDLAELAGMAGLSRYQLLRRFHQSYGVTPHAWLVQQRSERARRLIAGGAGLSAAAAQAGFADQSHMTRMFVRSFGFTPGQWRLAMTSGGSSKA